MPLAGSHTKLPQAVAALPVLSVPGRDSLNSCGSQSWLYSHTPLAREGPYIALYILKMLFAMSVVAVWLVSLLTVTSAGLLRTPIGMPAPVPLMSASVTLNAIFCGALIRR